jgi:hypothetical protein
VYDLTLKQAYSVAIRPEMRIPPNNWHVLLYDHAKSLILALEPEQSVTVAYETSGPETTVAGPETTVAGPETTVTRIEIKRQMTDLATETIVAEAK